MRPLVLITTDRRVLGPAPAAGPRQRPARPELFLKEALVDAVRATEHPVGGRALSVSASVGWAVWPWNPQHPRQAGIDQLLTLADQALYRAKAAGRNRAVGAEHDDAAPPLPEHPELRVRWRVA